MPAHLPEFPVVHFQVRLAALQERLKKLESDAKLRQMLVAASPSSTNVPERPAATTGALMR